MRKLMKVLTSGNRRLKIWESSHKYRGELYVDNKRTSSADFFEKDGDMDLQRVREYFGFTSFCELPFVKKNGRYIIGINRSKRIIWSNDDYEEWAEAMADEITDEEITPEYYYDCRNIDLSDERENLDIEVDGCIVAFADLGLWNGRKNGAKTIGNNVKEILYTSDDYATWYCDLYNVRCDTIHHDGDNNILYRVAKNREFAKYLVEEIAYHGMTEEQFRKATKSLRPYVAKVYGW